MKKNTFLLLVCLYGGTIFAQDAQKLNTKEQITKEQTTQPKGKILRIDQATESKELEKLYVIHEKGVTTCTHNKAASRMSREYPKTGKYASQIQKEVELGVLSFSDIVVTDISDNGLYLLSHNRLKTECKPFKHTWAKSRRK